jgi:Uma2 family endonuclease
MAEPAYPLVLPDKADDRSWPAQGEWTYEEYRRLPDDGRRYEVIRGFLYVSPAPSIAHQRGARGLFRKLDAFVSESDLGEVLWAPVDVLLPGGLAAPVQPDLVFFRTGNEPEADALNYRGVPDLVIEVLSRRTRRLDTRIKFAAYQEAGVPEVWFADPRPRTLVVYGLSEDATRYVELCRGGEGESVFSRVLPGLRVKVSEIFPRKK